MEYNSPVIIPMIAINFITEGHRGSWHLSQAHFNCVNIMEAP